MFEIGQQFAAHHICVIRFGIGAFEYDRHLQKNHSLAFVSLIFSIFLVVQFYNLIMFFDSILISYLDASIFQ
jgi:hypothetical protein